MYVYIYMHACVVCSINPKLILNHDSDTNDTHLNTMIIDVIVVLGTSISIMIIMIITVIAKPKWSLGLTKQSLEHKHETKYVKFDK